jgi:outer membrane protein assembly factor BamB
VPLIRLGILVVGFVAGSSIGCGEPAAPVLQADDGTAATQPANDSAGDPTEGEAKGRDVSADVEPAEFFPAGEPTGEGEDWPIFLGPREDGTSGETGFAKTWPNEGPKVLWRKRVGTGYSAPSIRGNRLVVHHRPRGGREIIDCLRADDGRPVWRFAYETDYVDPFGYNDGPRCTPLLTENRCYTYGAEGKLLCLDLATGEKIWMRDCVEEFSTDDYRIDEHWFFGIGCTPIVEGNLLITLVGGPDDNAVVAFDRETGKTVWSAVGKSTWDGVETEQGTKYEWTGDEHTISYSSPIAATIHGKRHVLCLVRQGLVSLDPATGAVNFAYWFRPRVHESVNAARPVVIGDRVFLSAAYDHGSAMLRIHEDGRGFDELWRDRRNLLTHWSTPIHVDGYLYGFSGRHQNEGELRCLDAKAGGVAWAASGLEPLGDVELRQNPATGAITDQNGKEYPWPFYGRGSAIQVEDTFVVLAERGTLCLVKVDPERLEELARTSYPDIEYPAWAAPVLSRGRLYLRDEDGVLCLELPRG